MRKIFILTAWMLLAACHREGSSNGSIQLMSNSPTVATVNGETVPQELLEAVARGRNLDVTKPAQRQQALDELTQYVMMAQEAQREKFDSNTQFQADVEIARLQGVANAAVAQIQQLSPITDDMIKLEYEQQVARAGKFSYDFSQLLFDKEDDAISAASEVIGGKAFSNVFDAWKDKAKQARAYTQVRLGQIPDTLGKALQALSLGETSKIPVKTEFGWHVLNLSAITPYVAPSLETVKDGMRRTMQARMVDQRVEELRKRTKILAPDGSPMLPAKTSPSTVVPQKQS